MKADICPQFRQELDSFLAKLDIEHYPSPHKRPQVNSKTEHRNKELHFAADFATKAAAADEAVVIIDRSFYEYNFIRPHQTLAGITKLMHYSSFEDELKSL